MSRLRRGRSAVKAEPEEGMGSAAEDAAALRAEAKASAAAAAAAAATDEEAEEESLASGSKRPRRGRPVKRGRKKARVAADAIEEAPAVAVSAAPAARGPWSCPVCTFQNGASHLACGMCTSERPAGARASASGWSCARCSMHNNSDNARCAICSTPREEAADGTGSGDSASDAVDMTVSSSAAAASAAAARPPRREEPKLQDSNLFLAGLEESLGSIDVSSYLKERLAHAVKPQWQLLESKMRGVDEKIFPAADVAALHKALVHSTCTKALRLRNTMLLLLQCGQLEIDQLAASYCVYCSASGAAAGATMLFCSDACRHTLCVSCAHTFVLEKMEAKACLAMICPASRCDKELSHALVAKCLSKAEFSSYSDVCFTLSTSDPSKFQRCPAPKCGALTEMVERTHELAVPREGIKLTDDTGKVLSESAWHHYNKCRLRCHSCNADFCTGCRVSPYHLGRTCAEHSEYQASRHCRYCAEQLGPDSTDSSMANGLAVCTAAACQTSKARACTTLLPCGHACFGVLGEAEHPPCLEEDCPDASPKLDGGDLCGICYVEELRAGGPVVQLSSCGHAYHLSCVLEKIHKKWSGTRITFGFLDCSTCKQTMDHPAPAVQAALRPILRLREEVAAKALARLTIEGMTKDAKLVTKGSHFYNKPQEYAMASFAYYHCFKCKKFYFGGRRDCEQNAAAEARPEDEFVCYDCADLKAVNCKVPSHAEFQLWKCRFCCNPAVWFCFGTTHFCDPCHVKAGETMARKRHATKQCPGPALCPLKVAHAPNGPEADCEFNIGCGVCQEKVHGVMAEKKKEEKINEEIEAKAAAARRSRG